MSKPWIVCLCGSTKFKAEYMRINARETIVGHIVLSAGLFPHADHLTITEEEKELMDILHLRKIEMADEVIILNVGGYIGESTMNEINHALKLGKVVTFLEPVECLGSCNKYTNRKERHHHGT